MLLNSLFLFFLTPTLFAMECPEGFVEFVDTPGCYEFVFKEGPYVNGPGQRRFSSGTATLLLPEGQSLEKDPFFYIWMKMPGHHQHGGRPIKMEKLSSNKNEYRFFISEIFLTRMAGQWFLRVDLDATIPHNPRVDYDAEFPLTDWED